MTVVRVDMGVIDAVEGVVEVIMCERGGGHRRSPNIWHQATNTISKQSRVVIQGELYQLSTYFLPALHI